MCAVYGAYHALETLSQLMQFSFDNETYFVPNAPWSIFDFPRFAHRGILVDSSRHFEPVETLKRVIDSLTYAKFNTMHWHIVDEQSFPFDSPSFPLLSEMGAYSDYERYTVDDVAEVVEYARQRGVRVMVEIGMYQQILTS
jgi:hexosaminidase